MIHKGKKVLDGTLEAIQAAYGQDTLRVRLEGDGADLAGLPGVERVTDFGQLQELQIEEGTNIQRILDRLREQGRVSHFELTTPSLHDIFVRIAGPRAQEAGNA
jgi:ABC-2 type transport system ATP-binding protein